MVKILVLGNKGMLGHILFNELQKNNFDVIGINREDLDIFKEPFGGLNLPHISGRLDKYDFIINCIGILNKKANNPQYLNESIYINSWFPHYLEELLKNTDTKIIHISTDCVYSGKQYGNKNKKDLKDAQDTYGITKSLGEINNNKDLTIRTSIIGPELKEGIGLLHWLLTTNETTIKGFFNHLWSGVTTLELTKIIIYYLNNYISGIQNVSTKGINKYNLLNIINNVFTLNKIIIKHYCVDPIDKRLEPDFLVETSYENQIIDIYNYIKESIIYEHYFKRV